MIAKWKRLMGFDAGPQNHIFFACDACKPKLEAGDVSCHHPLKGEPVEPMVLESTDCDLCREL